MHKGGIYLNVNKYEEGVTAVSDTPWSTLAGISLYSPEQIGVYDGAYAVSKGFCRSTPGSIMRYSASGSDTDYFNAISRELIYHRVMRLSGKSKTEADEGFLFWDAAHLPTTGPYCQTKASSSSVQDSSISLLPLAVPKVVYLE